MNALRATPITPTMPPSKPAPVKLAARPTPRLTVVTDIPAPRKPVPLCKLGCGAPSQPGSLLCAVCDHKQRLWQQELRAAISNGVPLRLELAGLRGGGFDEIGRLAGRAASMWADVCEVVTGLSRRGEAPTAVQRHEIHKMVEDAVDAAAKVVAAMSPVEPGREDDGTNTERR